MSDHRQAEGLADFLGTAESLVCQLDQKHQAAAGEETQGDTQTHNPRHDRGYLIALAGGVQNASLQLAIVVQQADLLQALDDAFEELVRTSNVSPHAVIFDFVRTQPSGFFFLYGEKFIKLQFFHVDRFEVFPQ